MGELATFTARDPYFGWLLILLVFSGLTFVGLLAREAAEAIRTRVIARGRIRHTTNVVSIEAKKSAERARLEIAARAGARR
jgi:hypothetical protein